MGRWRRGVDRDQAPEIASAQYETDWGLAMTAPGFLANVTPKDVSGSQRAGPYRGRWVLPPSMMGYIDSSMTGNWGRSRVRVPVFAPKRALRYSFRVRLVGP